MLELLRRLHKSHRLPKIVRFSWVRAEMILLDTGNTFHFVAIAHSFLEEDLCMIFCALV